METLFLLLAGHAFCDFAVQPEAMGAGKSRRRHLAGEFSASLPPWYAWLFGHAFVHGGMVWLITGSWLIGCLEVALHAFIDHLKCEGQLSFNQDQALHILTKFLYVLLLL
jgi:hypothetical protein